MKCFSACLLLALSASLGLTAYAKPADQPAGARRPNIVFLFSDDHAAQAIGAYGSKFARTPRLDRLAEQGIRFDGCFCTNAICGPSRAVVLTGKYSHINGVVNDKSKFDDSQQTFPKLLREAGYQTAMIGKWNLISDPTGFDYWEILAGQGQYYNPEFTKASGQVKYTGYVTDIITDLSIQWLKDRDKDRPFVLMCQHRASHRSWEPSPKYLHMFDDVTFPEPPTLFDDYAGRASPAAQQEMSIGRHMLLAYDLKVAPLPGDDSEDAKMWSRQMERMNPEQRKAWDVAYGPRNEAFRKANLQGEALVRWKYQQYMKDYLRCVAALDENVGRLLDYLEEAGLANNTVVMYSSDQGFYLGEHGWFDKRWMYEESLRMPLIVRWPGRVKAGAVDTHMTSNLDFAETFLEIAGVPVPGDMQGSSMVPLLQGQSPADWRKSFYYHYYEYPLPHHVPPHYGVRTERQKLIYYPLTSEWELFDLMRDPHEMKSVYTDPDYAQSVSELKSELARLRGHYRDTDSRPSP